jgi:hypothetical protein
MVKPPNWMDTLATTQLSESELLIQSLALQAYRHNARQTGEALIAILDQGAA